ncbi:MAG: DUF559 domain-containing protein [Hyphomonadaceae bacterium]|nr:DUF559 domain-containing protein [Hyphomonadaceae bacterium]
MRQKDLPRVTARSRRLRAEPTTSEARLWKALRALNREGANFRRQCALGRFVYDFGDYSARILIEVDGVVHELIDDVRLNDAKKDTDAMAMKFRLLRVSNRDVWGRLDHVVSQIRALRAAPHPDGYAVDPPRPNGSWGEGED